MARYIGPKVRHSRRENIDLGSKTVGSKAHAGLLRRLNVPPGMHGTKGRKKLSDFGNQLREKQKVKRMYGLLERQFKKNFELARKWKGNTGEKLLEFLERRLDNTLYRMGFAPTRAMARQLTGHGHVLVDDKKVTIPSYLVGEGMVIRLKDHAMEIPVIRKLLDAADFQCPEWVERKGPVGKVTRIPLRTDIIDDINEQLIVEYYSR